MTLPDPRTVPVVGIDEVGAYRLVRVAREDLDAGEPGQFFMVEAPGRVLPRPFSLCTATDDELGFLVDPIGPGTRAICGVTPGTRIRLLGPLGRGFDLSVERPVLVGGGIGMAPFPYLAAQLGGDVRVVLGFRTAALAAAAVLLPQAQVVVDPVLVTEALPPDPGAVLACGPEPMLRAVAHRVPDAQLAWEAPMACGFGACYGCVAERDGRRVRLCVEGPVLRGWVPA